MASFSLFRTSSLLHLCLFTTWQQLLYWHILLSTSYNITIGLPVIVIYDKITTMESWSTIWVTPHSKLFKVLLHNNTLIGDTTNWLDVLCSRGMLPFRILVLGDYVFDWGILVRRYRIRSILDLHYYNFIIQRKFRWVGWTIFISQYHLFSILVV